MNTVLLIGKILHFEEEKGTNGAFTIKVERSYQENDGSYKEDLFSVLTWKGICDHLKDNYKPSDMVAVKGRLAQGDHDNAVIVAEKVTLIM